MIQNLFHKTYMLLLVIVAALSVVTAAFSPANGEVASVNSEETKTDLEEKVKVEKALEILLESMKTEEFVYQIEGRADPFEPFISAEIMQEVAETSTPESLTGMRQFEPGQLSLVAIMFTESNPMAMVEDSSHKGYIIRRGTKIGKSGVVSDILPNQVVIKQLSYSVTKAKKYKTVEMTLRKEGEK